MVGEKQEHESLKYMESKLEFLFSSQVIDDSAKSQKSDHFEHFEESKVDGVISL